MRPITLMATLVAILMLPPLSSWAGFSSYRCGNLLVSVGDRKVVVETKCGEPKSKDVVAELKITDRDMRKTVDVEEWVYDFRYGWYDVLTFRGGKLYKIESVRK